jgi:hypothetical protein
MSLLARVGGKIAYAAGKWGATSCLLSMSGDRVVFRNGNRRSSAGLRNPGIYQPW